MKNIYLPIILLATILLSGCYKHDDINSSSEEKIIAVPEDSKDPLDKFIYEFYKNYNSVIYYNYVQDDYQWNMDKRNDNIYTPQKDKYMLDEGIVYLKKVFLDAYDDEFKKNHFPPAIFLAQRIDVDEDAVQIEDATSYYGISHLAIGKIRNGIENLSNEELIEAKASINADFWGGYLFKCGKINIPDAFYDISKKYYQTNLLRLSENSGKAKSEIDIRSYGFWQEDPSWAWGGDSYMFTPKKHDDIISFVKLITTHTAEEMDALLGDFSRLREKYNILTKYVKEDFGVDLQEIGNHGIN